MPNDICSPRVSTRHLPRVLGSDARRAAAAARARRHAVVAALALATAWPAGAGLLADGQRIRSIPFQLRDEDKPMVEATIAGTQGLLMVDNGTPDALFLNRAAVSLPAGRFVARGSAASGQAVEVQAHPTPSVRIAGQSPGLPGSVRSGDFAFTAPGLGADFLGFVGTGLLEQAAFVLDYARRRWVILRTDPGGALTVAAPQAADVVVALPFLIWPGALPTLAASVGPWPIVTDIDTGDGGTLYLTAPMRERLVAQGLLLPDGDRWRLQGLSLGGVRFDATPVQLVEAGGPQDFRSAGQPDQLRLGSRFLSAHPCLWNFPARTLTFLRPHAGFLAELAKLAESSTPVGGPPAAASAAAPARP